MKKYLIEYVVEQGFYANIGKDAHYGRIETNEKYLDQCIEYLDNIGFKHEISEI